MSHRQKLFRNLEYRAKSLPGIQEIIKAASYTELCKEAQRIFDWPVGTFQRAKYLDAYEARLIELNEMNKWGQPDGFTIKAQALENSAPNSDWAGVWN